MKSDNALGRLWDVIKDAPERWGHDAQTRMAIEECGELIVALMQFSRGRVTPTDVASEVADVLITAMQLAHIVGDDLVAGEIEKKGARLRERLNRRVSDGKENQVP